MEKMLIGSLELNTTKSSGKPVVELYSTNTALQFPELRLFDLSALLTVGMDPDSLVQGERIHRRLWAYYTVSDKRNKEGNAYRDVAHLEAIDQPATATSVDTSALLAELRKMNEQLLAIAAAVGATEPAPPPVDPVARAIVESLAGDQEPAASDEEPIVSIAEKADAILALPIGKKFRYANNLACSAKEAERAAFTAYVTAEGKRPLDVDTLREWVANTAAPRQG